MKQKVKNNKGTKGITLIALVITIIVLLILAGVSIATLTGQNGILTQATVAKDEMTKASAEEKVKVEVLGSYGENGAIDIERLNENLLNVQNLTYKGQVLSSENKISKLPATVNVDGYDVLITAPADAAAVKENATTYYGAEVQGYNCTSEGVNKWRIFYSDGNNIYLIADDYLHYDYVPTTKQGHQMRKWNEYRYNFYGITDDYSGISSINEKVKIWLNKFLEYGSNATSNQESAKAIAYMLDIDIWKDYAGEKAEYAIAGPTIEMYCESYKDTHPNKYIEYIGATNGYKIKWNTDTEYDVNIAQLEDGYNSIYVKTDTSKAYGMWTASSGEGGTGSLMCIGSYGSPDLIKPEYVTHYSGDLWGFRPIVCLNSEVMLQEVSNGVFSIN